MARGRYPYYIGGGLLGLSSLLLLISNILMLNSPGFEITAKPFNFLILQITPEGFAFLYILLPALVFLTFAPVFILRERLFYSGAGIWVLRISFLCAAINAALTYTSPEAIGKMYLSLQTWSGIDLFGLFGPNALWVAALFALGCYLCLSLGFHLLQEYHPAPYLIARTVSLAAVVFVWIPVLIACDSLDPGRSIVKPLLAVFALLFYILFENLRSRFSQAKDDNGYITEYSIPRLLIATAIMAVLLVAYLHIVYLLIDSWATIIVLSLIMLFANGKSQSIEEIRRGTEENNRRSREAYDRWVIFQRQKKEHEKGYMP